MVEWTNPNPGSTPTAGQKLRGVAAGIGLAIAGPFAAVALVFLAGVVLQLSGTSLSLIPRVVLLLVLTQYVGFGGVVAAYLAWRGLDWSYVGVRWPSRRELLIVAGGFFLALALVLIVAAILSALSIEGANNQAAETGLRHPELFLVLIPASFLVIGPCEELLFRGAVQRRLREALGPVASVLLASALFAAIHFLALNGPTLARLTSISVLFIPSLVLGATYEYTDNLVVSAAIHALYDALIFSVLYLIAT